MPPAIPPDSRVPASRVLRKRRGALTVAEHKNASGQDQVGGADKGIERADLSEIQEGDKQISKPTLTDADLCDESGALS